MNTSSHPSCSSFLLVLWLVLSLFSPTEAASATGRKGIVATVHPLATKAAMDAFHRGGNAIDAAVAAGLTLGVVDGANSGLGGGCLMLIRRADGSILALDGRESAPAKATRDMFVRNGRADTELSQTGPLATGVPGSLAVYDLALRRCGRLPLRSLLEPAAHVAEDGFILSASYASRLKESARAMAQFPATRAVFLDPSGQPWKAGTRLRQPDLAATYREIAAGGIDWFYAGEFGRRVEGWMRENGGLLTAEDFRSYRVRERDPIRTTYRGHEIIGFPPPSSGGIHVAQILNLVERFDLRSMGAGSADAVHVLVEAMKLAFADRAHWLGDSDFVPVPRGLTDKGYAAQLGAAIRLERAQAVAGPGRPPRAEEDLFRKHTTHFSTADAEGNWVACTATVNTTFGSKVVIPGTGVILNNQMDDFSVQPGATNYFGLVGNEANAVGPGKRPLSSMSPTIVLRHGDPILALGAAGGPTIISQVVLGLVGVLDFELPLPKALAQARIHHQWRPAELKVEKRLPAWVRLDLSERGHKVVETRSMGATQAVGRTPDGKGFIGAADPRTGGQAAGW